MRLPTRLTICTLFGLLAQGCSHQGAAAIMDGTDGGAAGPTGSAVDGATGADAAAPGTDAAVGPIQIPADPQQLGDPQRGYDALVNGSYVTCGVPLTVYQLSRLVLPEGETLPGRTGDNT